MAIDEINGKIRIYNYELSPTGFPSQSNANGVFVRGRDIDEDYVIERVSLEDVEIENTKSDLFKVGKLRFHTDEEDEIYKKLGIEDRSNIKTDIELVEVLKDSSMENVKRISNLKSSTLLLRMKALLFSMERSGNIPPHNISSVVIERCNELKFGGKRNKNSEINKILEADKKKNEENNMKSNLDALNKKFEKLEKENAEKDKTIEESKSAIQDLLSMVSKLKDSDKQQPKITSTTRKTAGKPKKTE